MGRGWVQWSTGLEGGRRDPAGLNLKLPPLGPSQACAPLYSWRTEKEPLSDPVGTCYLSTDNFTQILEYAPCRSGRTRVGMCLCVPFLYKPLQTLPPLVLCSLFGSGRSFLRFPLPPPSPMSLLSCMTPLCRPPSHHLLPSQISAGQQDRVTAKGASVLSSPR